MTLEEMLEKVEAVGAVRGAGIYDICKRKAGWGILWYEDDRDDTPEGRRWSDDKRGLVVYRYYPTIREAVRGELRRLGWPPCGHSDCEEDDEIASACLLGRDESDPESPSNTE